MFSGNRAPAQERGGADLGEGGDRQDGSLDDQLHTITFQTLCSRHAHTFREQRECSS